MAVAALQLSVVSNLDDDDDDDDDEDEGEKDGDYDDNRGGDYVTGRGGGRGRDGGVAGRGNKEVDEAFRLFVGGGNDREEVITLGMLKRVARDLKEEVSDGVLRDMILEANGGAGVGKGVRRGEFEGVMRRAGVFR